MTKTKAVMLHLENEGSITSFETIKKEGYMGKPITFYRYWLEDK